MKKTLRNLALSLCAFAFASCSDYRTNSESWWFRYHPEEDEAVYVEIQDGITANADAAETLRRLIAGWRRYPPEGGLVVLDLDAEVNWDDAPPDVDAEHLKELFLGLQAAIEIEDAGVFRIGQEGLGFYRVTRIKDLSLFLDGLNSFANLVMLEEWREGVDIEWEHFEIGPETERRWMQRFRNNEPWLTRKGSALVLDLPMSETEAAGFLRSVIEDHRDFPPDAWFMKSIEQIRIADGSLRLTFAPTGNRFQQLGAGSSGSQDDDHAALLEALEADPGFADFDRARVLERVK